MNKIPPDAHTVTHGPETPPIRREMSMEYRDGSGREVTIRVEEPTTEQVAALVREITTMYRDAWLAAWPDGS